MEAVGVGGLVAISGTHLIDLSSEFAELPLVGIADVALITGSVAAIGLVLRHDRRGWPVGGALALAAISAYILVHASGPNHTAAANSWTGMIGMSGLIAELFVVAAAVYLTAHPGSH